MIKMLIIFYSLFFGFCERFDINGIDYKYCSLKIKFINFLESVVSRRIGSGQNIIFNRNQVTYDFHY